jgi:hypothetical protein
VLLVNLCMKSHIEIVSSHSKLFTILALQARFGCVVTLGKVHMLTQDTSTNRLQGYIDLGYCADDDSDEPIRGECLVKRLLS